MTFHDRPARKITKKPEAKIRIAVPRSGWRTMRPTGIASSSAAMAKSRSRRPSSWRWKYHASISGTAIFMISEGWMRGEAEVQPAARAVAHLAEERHAQQEREAAHVDREREAHQQLRVDVRERSRAP